MINEPDLELKQKLRKAGISYREAANYLGRRYSVVNNWMNGFAQMPYDCRKLLLQLIDERSSAKQ